VKVGLFFALSLDIIVFERLKLINLTLNQLYCQRPCRLGGRGLGGKPLQIPMELRRERFSLRKAGFQPAHHFIRLGPASLFRRLSDAVEKVGRKPQFEKMGGIGGHTRLIGRHTGVDKVCHLTYIWTIQTPNGVFAVGLKAPKGNAIIKVNLPADLKKWWQDYASENMRPLNSQIVKEMRAVQERVTREAAEQPKQA